MREEQAQPTKGKIIFSGLLFLFLTILALFFLYLGPIPDSPSLWRREPTVFYPAMGGSALAFAVFTVMSLKKLFGK